MKRERPLGVGEFGFEAVKAFADGAVENIAADFDAQATEEVRRDFEFRGQVIAVFRLQVREKLLPGRVIQRRSALDDRVVLLNFKTDEALEFLENTQHIARLAFGDLAADRCDLRTVDPAIGKARLEKLLRELARIFVELHGDV